MHFSKSILLSIIISILSASPSVAAPGIKALLSLAQEGVPAGTLTAAWKAAGFSLSETYTVDKVQVTALDYAFRNLVDASSQVSQKKLDLVNFLLTEERVPWSPRAIGFANKYIKESRGTLWETLFQSSSVAFVSSVLGVVGVEQRRSATLWIASNRESFSELFPDIQDRLIISGLTLVGSFKWQPIRTTFQDFMLGKVEVEGLVLSPDSTLCCNQLPMLMSYLAGVVEREDIEKVAMTPIETEEPYFSIRNAGAGSLSVVPKNIDQRAMYLSVNACIYRSLGRQINSPHLILRAQDIETYMRDRALNVALLFFSMRGAPDIQHLAVAYLDPISKQLNFLHINDGNYFGVEESKEFSQIRSTYQLCDIAEVAFGSKKGGPSTDSGVAPSEQPQGEVIPQMKPL